MQRALRLPYAPGVAFRHRYRHAARLTLGVPAAAVMLAACGGWLPAPVAIDQPIVPLSKVNVQNQTDTGYHVRMNWPEGFVQVAWVEAGATQALTGAIGTSGFPLTLDILTEECELVASLRGLPPGNAGIVVISADGATLHQLHQADASWTVSDSTDACGASSMD